MAARPNRSPGDESSTGPFSRRFVRLQDLTLALAVVVCCAGFFLYRQQNAATGGSARVYLDGEEIQAIPLRPDDDYRIDLMEDYGIPVSFQVRGGEIRFVDVTCPDHICEKTGFISLDGQTAVCMPNRVAVQVFAGSE